MSTPKAVPWVCNCDEIVDIAAAISESRNMYTNHSGRADVMNVGMILSMLPPTISTAIFPKLLKKYTFESDPTMYAVVGMIAMNIPPIKTDLFSSLSDFTVMNLTINEGCARTPIPTPISVDETSDHQNGVPIVGNDVHPVPPADIESAGYKCTIFVKAVFAVSTPPSNMYMNINKNAIANTIIVPCNASVYITPRIPPNNT